MKYFYLLLLVVGLWMVASSMTEAGLLPSRHGPGRVPEAICGVGLAVYAVYKLTRKKQAG